MVLAYCIMKNIKVNWIYVFKEHMLKFVRLSDYRFPYVIIVSKFLQYFGINLDEELRELVNNSWVSQEEDSTGTSVRPSGIVGPSDDVEPSACIDEDYNMEALVAYEPLMDHGIPMS